ncbi:MAG: SDR family NAD(P)-dependent oxidoreductase [Candidatus Hodarchaeota archaeon]
MFDGKVVVITGAGGGIGRSHALAFAQEGAKVVVNDLGTTPDGSGEGTIAMADKVVEEIRQLGGEAVANYNSVTTMEGGENIIKTAIDNFGRIDILINNAGILRDKTLVKMEEKNWDIVIDVHLKGTFACSRAAARVMRDQGTGGRIINTVSAAGLIGNFGQSNYGAAKAGIAGFTRVIALELRRFDITVNCIAPLAKTRLTADVDIVSSEFKPEQVTPMVFFLASDKAKDITGRILGIHGQHLFEYQMKTTSGVEKSGKELWTVAEITEKFEEITKLPVGEEKKADESAVSKIDTLFQVMPQAFRPEKVEGWNATLHFALAGADDWCLTVQDGKASTSKEIPENPSCVIKMAADILTGLIDGSVDATKAFMAGKITANKLPDLMNFNNAFSFRKLQELLAASTGAPDSKPSISQIFQQMPTVFKVDKAGDWSALIHFKIAGDENQTLKVVDKQVKVTQGLEGNPDCIITTNKETLEGLIAGTLDPTKAFMAGDIKASKLPVLMKFNEYFALTKLGKAAAASVKAPEAVVTGLDPSIIGRYYTGIAEFVKPEKTMLYAKATNETNPKYFETDENKLIVPPVFPVTTLMAPLKEKILVDDSLNLDISRMVHAEHEILYHRPLKPWDLLYTTIELESIDKKHSGDILWAKINGLVEGELVYEMRGGFFFKKPRTGEKVTKSKTEEEPIKPEIIFSKQMVVAPDQSIRYAEASGDDNPIHIDKDVAKAAGLPDIILHGLCSMSFATQGVVDELAEGNPTRIKKVRTRFSSPVFMNDTLTTEYWILEEKETSKIIGFEMKNQAGKAVLTRGEVELLK